MVCSTSFKVPVRRLSTAASHGRAIKQPSPFLFKRSQSSSQVCLTAPPVRLESKLKSKMWIQRRRRSDRPLVPA
ncbi:hypothetical protein B0O99DRAFT_144811 [Bisporella sp. PMI_857]|nr:hypothetical protein B0O99DRAFT_144811 [Bisporella sp. PMI_857]